MINTGIGGLLDSIIGDNVVSQSLGEAMTPTENKELADVASVISMGKLGGDISSAYDVGGMGGVTDLMINKATDQFNANPVVQFGQTAMNPNATTNDLTSAAWKMGSSAGPDAMPSLMPQLMPSLDSTQRIKPINQSGIPSLMPSYSRGLLPYYGR